MRAAELVARSVVEYEAGQVARWTVHLDRSNREVFERSHGSVLQPSVGNVPFFSGDPLMSRYCILFLMVVSLLAVGTVQADPIAVPDASFEEPVVVDPPYTVGAGPLLPWVGQWASIANPVIYGLGYGEGYIVPQDGNQVLYLNPLSVSNRPWVYQTLPDVYVAGLDYSLSAAVAPYDGNLYPLDPGQVLTVRLGYWAGAEDGDAGPTIVSEVLATAAELTAETWANFTTSTGPVAGDAVGKNIVIYIGKADVSTAGPQWWVDDVRCVKSPEPGTIALLVSGLLGLVAYAWRKR
jgi:hypothetical protein